MRRFKKNREKRDLRDAAIMTGIVLSWLIFVVLFCIWVVVNWKDKI